MIKLDAVDKLLEINLAGAVATTELPFVSGYVDIDQTTFAVSAMAELDGTTNGAASVTGVAVPGAGTTRVVQFLSVFNVDTAPAVLTVNLDHGGTDRIIWKCTLAVGDSLIYTDTLGFKVTDANGQVKTGPTVVSLTSGVTGILPGANGGTGVNNGAFTITVAGNLSTAGAFTVAGAFATILRATAATDITLPTTGTLAILGANTFTGAQTLSSTLTVADTIGLASTKKLYFDGVAMTGDTYISESAANRLSIFSGGVETRLDSGVLIVNGFGAHTFYAGGTGQNALIITNTTDGTGNYVNLGLVAGTTTGNIYSFSQSWTTSSYHFQAGMSFGCFGAGGLSIIAAHASGAIRFYSGGAALVGSFYANTDFYTNDGTVHSLSDSRTKTLVRPFSAGLDAILAIQPTLGVYKYRTDLDGLEAPRSKREFVSVFAQAVQPWMPEAIDVGSDGYLTMTSTPIMYALMNATVELNTRIAALEARMN